MKFAIIVFPGTSCEYDTYDAIVTELGEKAEFVSHDTDNLDGYDAIILPGGTSYGDAVRPGAIAHIQPVMKAIEKAANMGTLVLGIGNGFQILLEAGILPGTMLKNNELKFICRPQQLLVTNHSSLFTSEYDQDQEITVPIAHGFGQYYCDEATLADLQQNKQIVFTYTAHNPNGSIANIAGITNKQGNVLGMMPHPERAVNVLFGSADGMSIFQSIVKNWRESYATNA